MGDFWVRISRHDFCPLFGRFWKYSGWVSFLFARAINKSRGSLNLRIRLFWFVDKRWDSILWRERRMWKKRNDSPDVLGRMVGVKNKNKLDSGWDSILLKWSPLQKKMTFRTSSIGRWEYILRRPPRPTSTKQIGGMDLAFSSIYKGRNWYKDLVGIQRK